MLNPRRCRQVHSSDLLLAACGIVGAIIAGFAHVAVRPAAPAGGSRFLRGIAVGGLGDEIERIVGREGLPRLDVSGMAVQIEFAGGGVGGKALENGDILLDGARGTGAVDVGRGEGAGAGSLHPVDGVAFGCVFADDDQVGSGIDGRGLVAADVAFIVVFPSLPPGPSMFGIRGWIAS